MEYYSAAKKKKKKKKEQNNSSYSDMDEPRDCRTEWSQTQTGKYLMTSFIHGILKNGTNKHICKRDIVTDLENKLMATKEEGVKQK